MQEDNTRWVYSSTSAFSSTYRPQNVNDNEDDFDDFEVISETLSPHTATVSSSHMASTFVGQGYREHSHSDTYTASVAQPQQNRQRPPASTSTTLAAVPYPDPVAQIQQRINALRQDHAVRKRQLQDELADIHRQTQYNLTRLQGKCEEVKQLKLWIREWDARHLDTSAGVAVVKEEAVKRQRVKEEEAEPQVKREVKLEAEEEKQVDEDAGVWSGGAWMHAQRERSPLMPQPQHQLQQQQFGYSPDEREDEDDYGEDGYDGDGAGSAAEEEDSEADSQPHKRFRGASYIVPLGELNPNHWSHRVSADNPHGFTPKTFDRLRAIEDPVTRMKEEKRVLAIRANRQRWYRDSAYRARRQEVANEAARRKKINAGFTVLTRQSHHWSHRLSTDNPRGYNEEQLRRIADAPTLAAKRKVELQLLQSRADREKRSPVADEFGLDRVLAMREEAKAEYAALMRGEVGAGVGDMRVQNKG